MTDSDWLDAIEARLRAATPGPWHNNPADWLEIWADRDPAGWDAFFIATLRTRLNPEPGRRAAHDAAFIAHAPEDIAALVAAVRERDAEIERLRKNHANLTSRMGFGDGVTEPQADNDTIMRAWDEMSSQSMEWLESESWLTDCYLAGHPETEDCHEHDPSLRLLNAEAALARVEALAAKCQSAHTEGTGMSRTAVTALRLAGKAFRAALADPKETE